MPAALTLRAAEPAARTWVLFAVGAGLYFSGHGIHLAANSVGNVDPSPTAHLWDERVGHLVWYAGAALVLAALATTMVGRARPGVLGSVLALAVGLTWATNALGGGTLVLSLVVAAAACWFGWRHREGLPVALLVGFAPAVVVLVVAVLV